MQLARIVHNRQHKTVSFQSGFLLLCFCWTFFRAFFFISHTISPDDAMFDNCSDDIIFTAPVPIQCFTYSLLIFFFAWNVNKVGCALCTRVQLGDSRDKASWSAVKRRCVEPFPPLFLSPFVQLRHLCPGRERTLPILVPHFAQNTRTSRVTRHTSHARWIAIRSVVCVAGDSPSDSQLSVLQASDGHRFLPIICRALSHHLA